MSLLWGIRRDPQSQACREGHLSLLRRRDASGSRCGIAPHRGWKCQSGRLINRILRLLGCIVPPSSLRPSMFVPSLCICHGLPSISIFRWPEVGGTSFWTIYSDFLSIGSRWMVHQSRPQMLMASDAPRSSSWLRTSSSKPVYVRSPSHEDGALTLPSD